MRGPAGRTRAVPRNTTAFELKNVSGVNHIGFDGAAPVVKPAAVAVIAEENAQLPDAITPGTVLGAAPGYKYDSMERLAFALQPTVIASPLVAGRTTTSPASSAISAPAAQSYSPRSAS